MKSFNVQFEFTYRATVPVQAETVEEAIGKADKLLPHDIIGKNVIHTYELGKDKKVVNVFDEAWKPVESEE